MLVVFGSDSEAYPAVYLRRNCHLRAKGVLRYHDHLRVTIAVLLAVGAFLLRTRWDFMRAVAQNDNLARLSGIRARLFKSIAFGGGAHWRH